MKLKTLYHRVAKEKTNAMYEVQSLAKAQLEPVNLSQQSD